MAAQLSLFPLSESRDVQDKRAKDLFERRHKRKSYAVNATIERILRLGNQEGMSSGNIPHLVFRLQNSHCVLGIRDISVSLGMSLVTLASPLAQH
ncbi:hypothetical protein J6590_066809 [Homalodisca vitripennis]|nr:hypothetical protein J6590_066809 [Homalodisca vitripennis]